MGGVRPKIIISRHASASGTPPGCRGGAEWHVTARAEMGYGAGQVEGPDAAGWIGWGRTDARGFALRREAIPARVFGFMLAGGAALLSWRVSPWLGTRRV
jgi:hypothetical protein